MQRWDPGAKVGITVAGGHGCGSGADQLSHPGAGWETMGNRMGKHGNVKVEDVG